MSMENQCQFSMLINISANRKFSHVESFVAACFVVIAGLEFCGFFKEYF